MAHLTLQEVVDRINQIYFSVEKRHAQAGRADFRAADYPARDPKHRPEFYIPRITRRLARFILST